MGDRHATGRSATAGRVALLGCEYDSASNWFSMFRTATGFAELQSGRDMVFPDGTLEWDGTKTVTKRKGTKRKGTKTITHLGRFLDIYHRETGRYALEPLKDSMVLKGAPPPPEEYDEVQPMILKKVRDGHVACSDSGGAFKKVAKKDLKPKGIRYGLVVHKKKQFSRVVKVPLKYLSARVRDRVAQLPTTTSRTYRFKAGNQGAEGVFGVVKRNLVRLNLSRSTPNASVNFLSSAWLHKHVGLEGVAEALSIYQAAIKDHCDPKTAFKSRDWLTGMEHMG